MSSPVIKHFGKILPNGNISFLNEGLWNEQRQSLAGKDFELTIKERVRKPTPSQFSYYWGGILPTCLKCEAFSHFYTVEEIHSSVFSQMFLQDQTRVNFKGVSYTATHTKSLSGLSKKELSEFIDKVLMWCGENGVEVLPAENYVNKFYREIDK